MKIKYTKEMLEDAVSRSISMAGVQRCLGLKIGGGSYKHVKERIDFYKIDRSHFLGQAANRGKHIRTTLPKWTTDTCFRRFYPSEKRPSEKRPSGSAILRCLLQTGLAYECQLCGLRDIWNGMSIRLEIDHIDGDKLNNVQENLRILCPNCHSQTDTYCGRNIKGT